MSKLIQIQVENKKSHDEAMWDIVIITKLELQILLIWLMIKHKESWK